MGFVTHLESAIDGTKLPANALQTVHQGRPLWVRYDLDAISKSVRWQDMVSREPTMWRYRELLPIPDGVDPVRSGESSEKAPVFGSASSALSSPRSNHVPLQRGHTSSSIRS